jgi:sulfoquinovosidase
VPDQGLYAPFSFEVGAATAVQFPAYTTQGNLIGAGDAGVQYAATRVTQASCKGDTAMLTLATNDPTGRTIQLVVRPDENGGAAIRVRATLTPDTGVATFSDSFDAASDEQFFGFGGHHDGLSQRGRSVTQWVQQENFGAGPLQVLSDTIPGTGGAYYQFPNGQGATYYSQALFHSSRPYSFLLENTELARFKLAYTARPDAWQVSAAAAELRYVVAPGTPAQRVATLTAINGRHRLPPEWAIGPTLNRGIRVLSPQADTGDTYYAKVIADLARVDADGLPLTSYSIEGWDLMSRIQLADVVTRLRAKNRHPMTYIRAYASVDTGNTEPASVFTTALQNGYCAKTAVGGCYLFGSPFIGGVALLVDHTDAATFAWWRGRVREMLDLGSDGFMQDFGESAMTDMRFANGQTGLSMHNRYPVDYHAATRAVLEEYRASNAARAALAGGDYYFFTRTGYSGRPGAAAYESANFPGDNQTDFAHSNGLASAISDMLSRGVGGAYGYSTDIGGYLDEITGATSKELFIRWSELAALTPVFRVHNSSTNGERFPWDFDADTEALWKRMAELHLRAKPLILTLWREAVATGMPIARPLWLQFPDDRAGWLQDQEFMLGPDVLVAPVVEQSATAREVYFPAGCWQHGETSARYQGPGTQSVAAALTSLPWFTRCGTNPF